MRIPGIKTIKLGGQWIKGHVLGGALILGYHRIANVTDDPYLLAVRPQHFGEQLAILRKYANPICLHALVTGLLNGTLPPRAVVLTFDDGYADNLYVAKPLLERFNIPATVFVTTGSIGRQFWWDELEEVLTTAQRQAGSLKFVSGDQVLRLNGKSGGYVQQGLHDFANHEILKVYHHLLSVSESERKTVLDQLWEWNGSARGNAVANRVMADEEILRLADGGLVEVGAHTVSHPFLAALSTATQRFEIEQSKLRLEAITGTSIKSFSYPNGSFSSDTMSLVRLAGYECGCASYPGIASLMSNQFKLPRFWVKDWDGDLFHRWLRKWLPIRSVVVR